MIIKNKRTGGVWDVPGGSPAAKRIAENPGEYEVMEPTKKKKGEP
jgi:hypothetical protein